MSPAVRASSNAWFGDAFDTRRVMAILRGMTPAEPSCSGERLLRRGLEVIVGALRAAKPSIAVMYYSLSPWLVDLVDQHCHDDLYPVEEEYDQESTRRHYLSSLLGELGMPTYGSGGYDWRSMPTIWRRTAISGPPGILANPAGDEHGELPSPRHAAVFNGRGRIVRDSERFSIEPLSRPSVGSVTGARSRSWLRYEDGRVTAVSLEAQDEDGRAEVAERVGIGGSADVVVSSLDGTDLREARRLGVVPLADGELELAGDIVGYEVTAHRLNGAAVTSGHEPSSTHATTVRLMTHLDGEPVEWLEVDLTRRVEQDDTAPSRACLPNLRRSVSGLRARLARRGSDGVVGPTSSDRNTARRDAEKREPA